MRLSASTVSLWSRSVGRGGGGSTAPPPHRSTPAAPQPAPGGRSRASHVVRQPVPTHRLAQRARQRHQTSIHGGAAVSCGDLVAYERGDVRVGQLVQPHPAEGWHQVLVRVVAVAHEWSCHVNLHINAVAVSIGPGGKLAQACRKGLQGPPCRKPSPQALLGISEIMPEASHPHGQTARRAAGRLIPLREEKGQI
jgi:hypothetical protein